MWKLNIEDDQANVTSVNLVRDEYTIGRDSDNAVRLTERNISRKHAILKRNDEGWVVRDLESYNGCFVNGKRVSGDHAVGHADLIQLGDYRLEVIDEEAAQQARDGKSATVPLKPLSQTLRELPDRLVMIAGPAVGVPFSLLEKRVVIGRGEECDLPINDTSVSRVHAEIQSLGDDRYEIVDLGSSNGVRVNGVELERAIIEAGDVIELGDVQLKFVPAGKMFNPDEAHVRPRRHSLEPGVGTPGRARSATGKIMAALALLAVLVVITIVSTRGEEPAEEAAATRAEEPSPAAKALQEAEELLRQGKVEEALHRAQDIPSDSNLRESTVFRQIHARWADAIFEEAANETDEARKRALLDLVAKSPDVDSVRRKRAVNEIAALDADSVDIQDLPSAARRRVADAKAPRKKPLRRTSVRPRRPPAPAKTREPPPATQPKTPPSEDENVKGGLIRETPF